MNWQRARTDEQKEQRIDAILEATARLYEQSGFEEIALAAVAREALAATRGICSGAVNAEVALALGAAGE